MIRIENLTKTFSSAGEEVKALRGVTLTVGKGEIYGVIGLSGAGKSTLVRCINLLEKPDDGRVLVGGRDLGALSLKELRLARRKIAMIFQHFDLLQQKNGTSDIEDRKWFATQAFGVSSHYDTAIHNWFSK